MAISHSLKWLPLLLAAASLITIASSDQALITSICSKTRNQALCFQVFKNSATADRGGLGVISTNAAWGKARTTLNLINTLAPKETDPMIKGQYRTCADVYDDALDRLSECKTYFAKRDFSTANVRASAADTDVDTCSDDGTSVAPQLKAANKENGDYIGIVLAVSNISYPIY